MSSQFIFSISYVPFVILIGMSCLYKGRVSKILKILSTICAMVAVVSYTIFIKNIL